MLRMKTDVAWEMCRIYVKKKTGNKTAQNLLLKIKKYIHLPPNALNQMLCLLLSVG